VKKTLRSSILLLLSGILMLSFTSCGNIKNVQTLPQPVQTISGKVEGIKSQNSNVMVYKGIPYAEPPVGDLRWKEPQPPLPWDGVLYADKFS
jgi:para-nitrobenzyl esterase